MRTSIPAFLLSAIALPGIAMAAPAASQAAPSISVRVVPAHRTELPAYDYKVLHGEYQMSNGTTLNVIGEGGTLYAELNGQARTELIPTGDKTFAARGADMLLAFERQAYSSNDVRINMPKK